MKRNDIKKFISVSKVRYEDLIEIMKTKKKHYIIKLVINYPDIQVQKVLLYHVAFYLVVFIV